MILTTDKEIKAAIDRDKRLPRMADAVKAQYSLEQDQIVVIFDNGIEMRFPRISLAGLENATENQLEHIEINAGRLLVWTRFEDEVAHYIPDMIAAIAVSPRKMAEMGRQGGSKTSPAKTAAVRANGKKGGRPPKTVVTLESRLP